MKKLLIALLLTLLASSAYGAGTCVESGTNPSYVFHGNKLAGEIITILCTHHTDNSLSAALASSTMAKLSGRYVFNIKSYPGATAPTDATDLEITDSDSLSLLGTNGTNFIDATSTLETLFYNTFLSSNVYRMPVTAETWTISTTNNAVASATFYLKFYLVP